MKRSTSRTRAERGGTCIRRLGLNGQLQLRSTSAVPIEIESNQLQHLGDLGGAELRQLRALGSRGVHAARRFLGPIGQGRGDGSSTVCLNLWVEKL